MSNSIPPSAIGEAVKENLNPWFIKLKLDDEAEPLDGRTWRDFSSAVSPLATLSGNKFEENVYDELESEATDTITSWPGTQSEIEGRISSVISTVSNQDASEGPTLLTQVPLSGEIAAFEVAGDTDLIILWPTETGVHARVIDIKGTWEEKPHHQIQTAVYSHLFEERLDAADVTYELDAGVVCRDSPLRPVEPDTIPTFTLSPRVDDLFRLLTSDGPFETALETPFEELPLTTGPDKQTAQFADLYNFIAVETKHLGLLGLNGSEQHALHEAGLSTLEDVAELYEPLENSRPYEYEEPDPVPEHESTVSELREGQALSERPLTLAQRAQAHLERLNPNHPHAHDGWWLPWIQGSGDGSLPEDDPLFEGKNSIPIERESMVRVYLHVEYDYIRDRIAMLSARVDCSQWEASPKDISVLTDSVGTGTDDASERQLLDNFLEELFETIRLMGDFTGQGNSAPVHFYVYTQQERDELMNAAKRHSPSSDRAHAMRDLLSYRDGLEQPMVSVVETEIKNRKAVKQPCIGLLPMLNEFSDPQDENASFDSESWNYSRSDGTDIDLSDAFRYRLFDHYEPYVTDGDGIKFLLGDDDEPDGFYSLGPRPGSQIPLEYIWACGDIDAFGPEWTDKEDQQNRIERFRWADPQSKEVRISEEDVCALGTRFCNIVQYIERNLIYRNSDIEKQDINISSLDTHSLGEGSLSDAVQDYLSLEYTTATTTLDNQYKEPVVERVADGRSVPIRVEEIIDRDGNGFKIECTTAYDLFGFNNPQEIASAAKLSGGEDGGSGSMRIPIPLGYEDGSYGPLIPPYRVKHSPSVTVEEFDPLNERLVLNVIHFGQDHEYSAYTKKLQKDNPDGPYFVETGQEFLLEEGPNDWTKNKSVVALKHVEKNSLYRFMTAALDGATVNPDLSFDLSQGTEDYLSWVEDEHEPVPNPNQTEFIKSDGSRISLLQGPPGTGKTSGALSHALLARAYGFESLGKSLRGAVTGASHKSIDEVLEDVNSLVNEHGKSGALSELNLVKLAYDAPPKAQRLEHVDYVSPNDDEGGLIPIQQALDPGSDDSRQSSLGEHMDDGHNTHYIVFGTISELQKLVSNFTTTESLDDRYRNGDRFFNILAADEASMQPLWQLLTASAFLEQDGQVMLTGDQRQMPPVQQHEWAEEDRRFIEEYVPYLSSLDYFRFLRGEDVESIEDDATIESPDISLPMAKLEESYRCHTNVAAFLHEWVYEQDGIAYTSKQEATIQQPPDGLPEAVEESLRPERPMTVLLHDDTTSAQSNRYEAHVANALIEGISDDESIGIVTPHNAQKGLLNTLCGSRADIDTVERFQGGQKDVIILSATVSDPDQLQSETEFLLNPNRLNVALSRMKKKLIILAPESLFRLLPNDVDTYDDAMIWKGLYRHVDGRNEGSWEGDVSEITSVFDTGECNVRVLHGDE